MIDAAPSRKPKMHEASSRSIDWVLRPMRHEDIGKCLEIWLKVELAESRQTVASALETDPGGFFVAERVPDGQVVGMCAGPMTRDDTAFMGFYAVDPEFQGIGIGRELWAKTVGRLDGSINIGLYGVPTMSEKYKRSGFKFEDPITMSIYESTPDIDVRLDLLRHLDDLGTEREQLQAHSTQKSTWFRIEPIDERTSERLLKKLIAYDASVQMFSRETLLRNYLTKPNDTPTTLAVLRCESFEQLNDSVSSTSDEHRHAGQRNRIAGGERKSSCCYAKPSQEAIIENEALSSSLKTSCSLTSSTSNVARESTDEACPADSVDKAAEPSSFKESLVGYGCVRLDNTSGGMVGPLYADSDELCEVLLKSLLLKFRLQPGAKYSIMSLSSNPKAGEILERIGLTEVDKCSRMFTSFIPSAATPKIYYVHSPNFTLF